MTGLEHQKLLKQGVPNQWLIMPNKELGDRRPIDCLYDEVVAVLPTPKRRPTPTKAQDDD